MLDKQIFETLLTELATYYKRPITPFVQDLWYEYLSSSLTTDQFTQAVSRWLLIAKSMPSALQLVEVLKGKSVDLTEASSVGTKGLLPLAEVSLSQCEWDICVHAAPRSAQISLITGLSPQGQFALRLVGGLDKLGMCSEDQLTLVKRQFLSVWEVMRSENSALPRLVRDPTGADLDASLSEKLTFSGNGKGR